MIKFILLLEKREDVSYIYIYIYKRFHTDHAVRRDTVYIYM